MDKQLFSRRIFFLSLIIAVFFLLFGLAKDFFRGRTKIVFCDVGQGDGAYIRTTDNIDLLIDAGPNRKILDCLGKHMPFYDRTIELAFLSHPQKDHYGGYLFVLDRYRIDQWLAPPVDNENKSFSLLKEKLREKQIPIKPLLQGSRVLIGDRARIEVFWPERQFVLENSAQDLNDFSSVFLFSEGKTDVLFTGDASPLVLALIKERLFQQNKYTIDILKVPHHGSKNGLTPDFLQLAEPALSVISVGRKNAYGHPSRALLELFQALKKPYLRTDQKGDIVIDLDAEGWRTAFGLSPGHR